MTQSHVWHDSVTCVTWLSHMCDMTQSHVWHNPFICVTWAVETHPGQIRDVTHTCRCGDSSIYVTWLLHLYSHVRHDSYIRRWRHISDVVYPTSWVYECHTHEHDVFTCEAFIYLIYIWMPHTWIRHVICDVTYTYIYEAFIYVTRFIHVWHDSFMYATWLIHAYGMTHSCV